LVPFFWDSSSSVKSFSILSIWWLSPGVSLSH
jgi:hypothetical protein